MGLSRKRQRELKRLRVQAEAVLHDQREALEHAARVIQSASRHAANYARDDVSPRVKETYQGRIKPALSAGVSATRSAAHQTRERFAEEVLPAVSSALGTALAALEVARSPQVREAINAVTSSVRDRRSPLGLVPNARNGNRNGGGPGKYILLGLGVVAVAGVAYAAWQTLRTGDDLWIDDEAGADAITTDDELGQ